MTNPAANGDKFRERLESEYDFAVHERLSGLSHWFVNRQPELSRLTEWLATGHRTEFLALPENEQRLILLEDWVLMIVRSS
jgi:hypothetical protein